jgi:crotonobetainyl-CoA:carnitine CoA-transferase CaiB-like acyl-CoA transferase
MVVACAKEVFWTRLTEVIDRDEFLAADYATFADRLRHRDELLERLGAAFSQRTSAEWIEVLASAGVPCAPVNDLSAAMDESQATARDLFRSFEHPTRGKVTVIRSPLRVGDHDATSRVAPALGQDTDALVTELLQADADELRGLRAAGAFGPPTEEPPIS